MHIQNALQGWEKNAGTGKIGIAALIGRGKGGGVRSSVLLGFDSRLPLGR